MILLIAPTTAIVTTTVDATAAIVTATADATPSATTEIVQPMNPAVKNVTREKQKNRRLPLILALVITVFCFGVVVCVVTILCCHHRNPGLVRDNVEMVGLHELGTGGAVIEDVERQSSAMTGVHNGESQSTTSSVVVDVESQAVNYFVERERLAQTPIAVTTSLERLNVCLEKLKEENERRSARLFAFRQTFEL